MKRIKIISVGRTKQPFILEGEDEYLRRLRPRLKIDLVEIDPKRTSKLPPKECMREEAKLAREALSRDDRLWLLDERGKQVDSKEFAAMLQKTWESAKPSMAFLIGGAYGTDDTLKRDAAAVIALSKLTFPYQLARLVLIEQLYRAVGIISGTPYHK